MCVYIYIYIYVYAEIIYNLCINHKSSIHIMYIYVIQILGPESGRSAKSESLADIYIYIYMYIYIYIYMCVSIGNPFHRLASIMGKGVYCASIGGKIKEIISRIWGRWKIKSLTCFQTRNPFFLPKNIVVYLKSPRRWREKQIAKTVLKSI